MIHPNDIFNIESVKEFESLALEIFKFQFENNPVYRSFCDLLFIHPSDIKSLEAIPFLPIEFFKTHEVITGTHTTSVTFTSSGTTGSKPSRHKVTDVSLYEKSFRLGFQNVYGSVTDYAILALLPSYLEREGSSLIYMVNDLVQASNHPESGFYLNDLTSLAKSLKKLEAEKQPTLLIGVSFALLDLIEQFQFKLQHTLVMETGGMKGRRKELIRSELHKLLEQGFGIANIHSEYGMTELLSQAYSQGQGIFSCPPWMKVLTRDTEDALTIQKPGKTGGLNIIDLANINSCAFIATQDLGKVYHNEKFEVLGRFDHSDIRGCNLMAL